MGMYFLLSLLLCSWVLQGTMSLDDVEVEMFTHRDYKGEVRKYIIERCTVFPWMGNRVSSLKILRGTCLKIFSSKDCRTTPDFIKYPSLEIPLLQKGKWNDNLKSVQPCSVQHVHVSCPSNTFVRRMDFSSDLLSSGITLHCFKPGHNNPSRVINTHEKIQVEFSSKTCEGAMRGIEYKKNQIRNYVEEITPFCHFTDTIDPSTLACEEDEALVGLKVHLENNTDLIKHLEIHCHKVNIPARNCTPSESFQSVSICDNSKGLQDMNCKFSQTVGVQISQTSTKSERKAHRFYADFELTASANLGLILHSAFTSRVGYSQVSQYNWRTTSRNTWTKLTQVEVFTVTPPGVITRLEQLVGQCSYYNVEVNYFKRIDSFANSTTASNSSTTTTTFEESTESSNNYSAPSVVEDF